MLLNDQGWEEYKKLWNLNDVNMFTTVPAIDNAASQPSSEPGDGSFGVLEGIASRVNFDGVSRHDGGSGVIQTERAPLHLLSAGKWMEIP